MPDEYVTFGIDLPEEVLRKLDAFGDGFDPKPTRSQLAETLIRNWTEWKPGDKVETVTYQVQK